MTNNLEIKTFNLHIVNLASTSFYLLAFT